MATKQIEYNGEKKSIADWSRQTGIAAGTIQERLGKGWEIERALTAVPDSHAPDSRRLAGRELKESFVELALKVYKRNVKSCEAALDAAFKADPIRAMKELVAYLPKDAVERAMPNTEKAIVRIELCQPAKQIEYIDAGGK